MALHPVATVPPVLTWYLEQVPPVSAPTVGSLVPPAFTHYVRVLNPATGPSGETYPWRTIAGKNYTVDATSQWTDVAASSGLDRASMTPPETGSVHAATAVRLAEILARHTTTPDHCYFLSWAGYSYPRQDLGPGTAATITLYPGRTMYILGGTVHDATDSIVQPPARRLPLWWIPADRAWCVGNDLYGRSVFIGGDAATIAEILADDGLEAYVASRTQPVPAEDF